MCTRRAYVSHRLGFTLRYVDAAFIIGVRLIKILKEGQVTTTINPSIKLRRGQP